MSNVNTNKNGLGGFVMDRDIGQDLPLLQEIETINQSSNNYFVKSVMHRTLVGVRGLHLNQW